MGTTETLSSLKLIDDNAYNCIPDKTYQHIEALPTTNISTQQTKFAINLEVINKSWSVCLQKVVRMLSV